MIENAELIMQMLEMYQMYKQQVPVELEEYLRYVAKTGNTLFQWTLVKPFIREKILNVIAEFAEQTCLADIPPYPNVDPFNYEAMKNMLLERFDTFNGPPFTIQRLCELLSCPRKEYNRVDKFMRAVEKNILVVSTCDLKAKREETIVNGVPDRWENGKELDINMDFVEKANIITADPSVLNGNDTVESLLNELESMKTPETKPDENKDPNPNDNLGTQESVSVEPKLSTEDSNNDKQENSLPIQNTETTEEIKSDIQEPVTEQLLSDVPKEQLFEVTDTTLNESGEHVIEKPLEEFKDLPKEASSNYFQPKSDEPVEKNEVIDQLETLPTEPDRVEGSIIHQTPDCDNKLESELNLQLKEVKENVDKGPENMDVQIENESKCLQPKVDCDENIQSAESTEIENKDGEQSNTVVSPITETNNSNMDVEPEKIEINEAQCEKAESNAENTETCTTVSENSEEDNNKLTEIE